MFIVDQTPKFVRPVKVQVPVDCGFEEQSCKVTYRVIPVDEGSHLDLGTAEGSTAFLRLAIVHIADLADKDKKSVTYNDAVRDQIISLPYFRTAAYREYNAAMRGEAAAGN